MPQTKDWKSRFKRDCSKRFFSVEDYHWVIGFIDDLLHSELNIREKQIINKMADALGMGRVDRAIFIDACLSESNIEGIKTII